MAIYVKKLKPYDKRMMTAFEDICLDLWDKVKKAESLEDLSDSERDFVLSLGASLDHVQSRIETGELSQKEFRAQALVKMNSVSESVYGYIKRANSDRPYGETVKELFGVDVKETKKKNQLVVLADLIDIVADSVESKIMEATSLDELDQSSRDVIFSLGSSLEDVHGLDDARDAIQAIVVSNLAKFDKSLAQKIQYYTGEDPIVFAESQGFPVVEPWGAKISGERKYKRMLELSERVGEMLARESKKIDEFLNGADIELSDGEKRVVRDVANGESLQNAIIKNIRYVDVNLYKLIAMSNIFPKGTLFSDVMKSLGFEGYKSYEIRSVDDVIQMTREYLSNKNNIKAARASLIKKGMRPEDITKRDIRFLLIRNMYEFDPNLKRAISVISKDEFGGLTFNEKIKFIAGVDPQEEYKAFLSRYIIAQTMRSENIEIAKRDLAFRGEVPDDEKIQEYIINNLRKFNLQLYFYLNSTTNITGNSKAPLNKKFEELGFEREGLRKSAVENLRVLLDPESGLPSMRDSAGFVDQFRKYARLEHAAERLALVLDMPASLVVQLVAGEELASSHVTTEYLTFAKKMFQNYLAENNGEISSIEHKNPRMFYMLVNIARNIETGNLERPSLYEVMKFLGGDALDDSKPHGFVKVSETHAFDRIQAFMKEIKEKFGDTVKPADFVGEYNYQAREVYELANRLGTTASDVYASFGINFETKKNPDGMSTAKVEKYPYIDEMRAMLQAEMDALEERIAGESDDFKAAVYLAASKRVYEEFKDRILSADFELEDTKRTRNIFERN